MASYDVESAIHQSGKKNAFADVASAMHLSLGSGVTLQPGDETAAPGAITLPENWDDLELFFEPHAAASMAFGHMGGHDHIGGSAKRKSMTADKEKITMAGRCRLLLSNPVLKAHVVSALEATYNMMNCFQTLVSDSSCAATRWRRRTVRSMTSSRSSTRTTNRYTWTWS